RRPMAGAVRKCGTRFLMPRPSMDNDRGSGISKFLRAVPNLLNKRTRSVLLLHLHAALQQAVFDFKRGSERGYDHDVIRKNLFPGNELRAVGVHNKSYTAIAQIVVHFRVMDHLAQRSEEHTSEL